MTNEKIAEEMIRLEGDLILLGSMAIAGSSRRFPSGFQKQVEAYRKAVLPLLERARREGAAEALANDLPGAPMSEEEVAESQGRWNEACRRLETARLGNLVEIADKARLATEIIPSLFAHIRWLTRIVHDLSLDNVGEAYKSGYEEAENSGESKKAFDVLIRKGWSVRQWRDGGWGVINQDGFCPRELLSYDHNSRVTPQAAVLEADKYLREKP
jgi:hypothetical protein